MSVKKILVIRFSSLGDIILLTPLIRAIKNRYPHAEIDFLTSTTFSQVCENNPYLTEIIQFDRARNSEELRRVRRIMSRKRYDLIVDAHRSLRSRLILFRCLGPLYVFRHNIVQIDKRSFKRNILLSTGINLLKKHISQREAYVRLVKPAAEIVPSDLSTELFPGPAERHHIDNLLNRLGLTDQPLVMIGPSASFTLKTWPKERFQDLVNRLRQAGYKAVLVGGKNDPEPGWIADRCDGEETVDLSGQLTFLETAELARRCCLVISNDSAVAHFGEAVGTPVIAIFGPTVKEFGFAPYLEKSKLIEVDLKCRPCSRNGKGKCRNRIHRQCMMDIEVQAVLQEALHMLS